MVIYRTNYRSGGLSPARNTQVNLGLPTLSLGIIEVGLHDLLKWGRGLPLHEFPIGKGISSSLQVDIDQNFQTS